MSNDDPKEYKELAKDICVTFALFFDKELDLENPKTEQIVRKTIEKIRQFTGSYCRDTVEHLMMCLEDWTKWTDKEDLQIKPGHMFSDKVWDEILPKYLEIHPEIRDMFNYD